MIGPHLRLIGRRGFLAALGGLAICPHAAAAEQDSELLALINGLRSERGLRPLLAEPRLAAAARRHAQDLARRDRLDHAGSDGSTPLTRARDAGHGTALPGEVIAASPDGPPGIFALWMASPPHRDILLAADATEAGVGRAANGASRYRAFWVVLLNPVVGPAP